MRFVFLGTGTSAGVPAIGCDCPVCSSADPRDHRTRTSAFLHLIDPQGHERVILIDTSPDLRAQALRERLRRCDAILFTHNHVDHTFGLDEVRRFNAVQKTPISIYAEAKTMGDLRRVFAHIFDKDKNVNDSFVASLIPYQIEPEKPFDLYGLRVTPLRILHGKLGILGYRFDVLDKASAAAESRLPLAYCTDVSGIPPETWKHLRGLKTLVLDALRHRKHQTHLCVDEAVTVAENVGAEETYFVHMSHDLPHAQTNAELPDGIRLAHDGLVLGQLETIGPAAG
ncbi:MAG: MBL fold metallo-hydrolase [Phycisphaerae bacterium]|nr:Phosphoribosyl 1,2-cyclic phosphate phosphodiesterase [Phycisphaerales bacterium]MCK6476335.1 MBL fold metallo-hydrolase [Phycisphaerales bacterium]